MKKNELNEGIPKKVLTWGWSIIVFSTLAIILIIFFLKYPEKHKGNIVITTKIPPTTIYSKKSGEIKKLFHNDNDLIRQNEILCVVENNARYRDVTILEEILSKFDSVLLGLRKLPVNSLELGELQPFYVNLQNATSNYLYDSRENYTLEKIQLIKSELEDLKATNKYLRENLELVQSSVDLMITNFDRNTKLYKKGVISALDMEKSKLELIEEEKKLKDLNIQILNNKQKISQLSSRIVSLEDEKTFKDFSFDVEVKDALENLNSKIREWKENYVIRSPISGTLSMRKIIHKNQFISASEPLFVIVPNEVDLIGWAEVPIDGLGKIETGSNTLIKLKNYPYKEFGLIEGKVKNISLIPNNNNNYRLEIELTNGLQTSYGIAIPYTPEMIGSIEVITEKRSLFDSVLEEFKDLVIN